MAKYLFERSLGLNLVPSDDEAKDAIKRIRAGEGVWVELRRARNPKHHRQYFALLHLVFENQEKYRQFEPFRKAVQIAAGHVEELITLDGEVLLIPKSIDYASLDDIEFAKVFSEVMAVCVEHFLQGVKEDHLRAEIERYAA